MLVAAGLARVIVASLSTISRPLPMLSRMLRTSLRARCIWAVAWFCRRWPVSVRAAIMPPSLPTQRKRPACRTAVSEGSPPTASVVEAALGSQPAA
jgi:hypothetical protein